MRGDGASVVRLEVRGDGSPPRAWGRHWEGHPQPRRHRFTPTCVGTALRQSPRTTVAYLRFTPTCVGTAQVRIMLLSPLPDGSPPRAWGRRYQRVANWPRSCHGSPPRAWGRRKTSCRGWSASLTVHPHVRGDGYLWLVCMTCEIRRFTPTCVGTASWPSRRTLTRSVHPHVRGTASEVVRICSANPVHPHVRGDGASISEA